mmetsp:Transcript_14746/g.50301  ORF Transcript_14746/g.50301 Transcript_14746/m.50301 type:complete len:94 (+) Transcript_14746:496-777(+)
MDQIHLCPRDLEISIWDSNINHRSIKSQANFERIQESFALLKPYEANLLGRDARELARYVRMFGQEVRRGELGKRKNVRGWESSAGKALLSCS